MKLTSTQDRIVLAAAGVALIGATALVIADRPAPAPVPQPTTFIEQAVALGYEPCVTEDDLNPCYWDASARGNGEGRSFVWTGDEVIYE